MSGFSLRRLTLLFLTLFLVATAATGLAVYSASVDTIRLLADKRIEEVSFALAPEGKPVDRADLLRRIVGMNHARDTGDLGIILREGDRQTGGNVRLSRDLPPGFATVGVADNIKGLTQGRAIVRDIAGGRRLIVVAETEPFDQYDRAHIRISIMGFGLIILVVLGGMLLFSRIISRRITAMRDTVATIIDGDMGRRVPLTGDGSEFDLQAAAFNSMLDRIQQLMEEIGNVTNDIAHELRTPLTRLRGRLALLLTHSESDRVRTGIGDALDHADALLSLFTAMLRIAEIESGERRKGFAPVALTELVEEIVSLMEPVGADSGHRVEIGAQTAATINGDRQLLAQMLLNLVENAVRHTPAGVHILVSVIVRGEHVDIRVADDGPGIPAAQRTNVLRRFARTERSGSGHGLGLPLVDAIARLHGGEIRLEDAGPGLTVVVSLPRA